MKACLCVIAKTAFEPIHLLGFPLKPRNIRSRCSNEGMHIASNGREEKISVVTVTKSLCKANVGGDFVQ